MPNGGGCFSLSSWRLSADFSLQEVKNGKNFLDSSKGILVFPRVLKGGAGFGGEYGEGALRVAGKSPYTPNIMPSVAKDADDRARSVLMVLHLPLTGMND